jgi:hypothetical protein
MRLGPRCRVAPCLLPYALRKIFFLHRDHSSSQQNKTAAMEYNNDAFAGFAPNASKRACARFVLRVPGRLGGNLILNCLA